MSKFPDPFVNDYRSKYKDKKKRGVSKHSSFQPFFNSDEFYNPVYTESVTSIEQQLDILVTGNGQNATHALNSLSFVLENPFKKIANEEKISLAICGNLLYYSFDAIQNMVHSLGWKIEYFSQKNHHQYTHILLGVRPNEKDLSLCTSLSIPLTVEYHLKRYFDRKGIQPFQSNLDNVEAFITTVLHNFEIQHPIGENALQTILFAIELFGASKAVRQRAREYLKEYLNDDQKDALRLHWFKQPTKYGYNPKFFHDVSTFLETVSMNGQLFQETAFQLTTLPTTQELLASTQAKEVITSLVETQFRAEFFETLTGIVVKNIDTLTLHLQSMHSLNEIQYLSFQDCEISTLISSNLSTITHLSLLNCRISESDFCSLIESLPKVRHFHFADVMILPSKNSTMYRLKFSQCTTIAISQLEYEFSNDFYKKIANVRSLKKLTLENYSLNSSLHSVNFTTNTSLEEVSIAGFSLENILSLGLISKKLQTLSIRSTGIQSLVGLETLTSLISLQITDEIIDDISPIIRCKQLQSLSLRSCNLEKLPDEIFECVKLEIVDLSSNAIQTAQIFGKRTSKLQRLICSNNQIKSFEMSDFPKLKYVYLSKNELQNLPNFVKLRSNKDVTIDLVDNPLQENEVETAMKLIRKGWRILCSLPKNNEEITENKEKQ